MGLKHWLALGAYTKKSSEAASAPAITGPLLDGASLIPGQSWRSRDGRTVLTLDRSGRLSLILDGRRAWKPPVSRRATKLLFDGRGCLILFDDARNRLWTAGVSNGRNAELHLQDDGNAVIYSSHVAVWSTETRL